MNERIEKLLEQCQIETYGVNGELLEFGFDAEKFAELIVKECCDQVRMVDAMEIKRHFGVEE
jgi:hypothetical protein